MEDNMKLKDSKTFKNLAIAYASECSARTRYEFCEYGYLNDLCHTADCILIPYLFTDLSSGALGYAAVHHTPVIGPASGLIGELISDNSLGECVDKISAETLKKAICEFSYNANDCFSKYAEDNSSLQFVIF